jgi:phage baseplate assembly protein W
MANTLYTRIPVKTASTLNNSVGPQMYRGFSTVNTNTQNFALYDFELIKQDLLNHFYIRKGERLMQPDFGTIIWDLLFEPLTDDVKDLILQNVNEIVNFDPRVQASNVVVTGYDQGIQVECILTYKPYNLSEQLQISFDQNNGLSSQTQLSSTV